MNNLCMSIGDCGSNVNYLGKGTDNVVISGLNGNQLNSSGSPIPGTTSSAAASAPSVYSWNNYISDATPVAGQYISVTTATEEEESSLMGMNFNSTNNNYNLPNESLQSLWGDIFSGAAGIGLGIGSNALGIGFGIFGGTAATATTAAAPSALFTAVAPWFSAAGAIFAGIALGAFLGNLFNDNPNTITLLMIIGGIGGAGAAILILYGSSTTLSWIPIVGWVLIAIAVLVFLWNWLTGNGTWETRVVEFQCQPWEAPNGGSDCSQCNSNPLKPCTSYRCSALGQECVLLNANVQNPVCASLPPRSTPPVISAGEVETEGYEFQNENSAGSEIVTSDGSQQGCVNELTNLDFTLNTDEFAQCEWNFTEPSTPAYIDYSKNGAVYGNEIDENLFEVNHTLLLPVPSIDDPNVQNVITTQANENAPIIKYGNLSVYVECQDGYNPANFDVKPYVVNLCIVQGPPSAVSFESVYPNPANGTILPFGTTAENLTLLLPQPANCKYDTTGGIDYSDMQYSMNCKTGISDEVNGEWNCSTTLDLNGTTNNFYFKCNNTVGKIDTQDWVYTLGVSPSLLKIDSVSLTSGIQQINFGGELDSGFEPITVNAKVETSGGGYEGNSYCSWATSSTMSNPWPLMSPYSPAATIHNQPIIEMAGGNLLYINCYDDAGNTASTSGEFIVNVHSSPPVITGAYNKNGNLNVVTNEPSTCYYNTNTCIFNLNNPNATSMEGSNSVMHTAPWSPGIIYYTICKDNWGNIDTQCTAISPSQN